MLSSLRWPSRELPGLQPPSRELGYDTCTEIKSKLHELKIGLAKESRERVEAKKGRSMSPKVHLVLAVVPEDCVLPVHIVSLTVAILDS